MQSTKRQQEDDGRQSPSIIKKFKPNDDVPVSVIKHYIIDKAQWELTQDQIRSLFKCVRIAVLDDKEVDKNNNVVPHYHILGEAKVSQRKMRDWSLANIRAAGVKGGLEAKGFYLTARVKNIESLRHFNNTIEYLKRKNGTFFEDENVGFGPLQNPVWKILDEAEEPAKFSPHDMAEFRKRFPLINDWHRVAAQKKLNKYAITQLQEMEAQRKHEERIRDLTVEEKHLLLPNMPILKHAFDMRTLMLNHDRNSGVCLVLCGGAMKAKSTITRMIANSLGENSLWPGSQWIQKDMLKFDTAAKQGVSTFVVEEMQWIDLQHRITLNKTLCSIKEQLTGAGLDVRLAKTKTNLVDDVKFKMDHLLISMNPDEYVNYRTLSDQINSRPEFKRRFLLVNMDDERYADITKCIQREDNNWAQNYKQMEWLGGKLLRNCEMYHEMMDLYEEKLIRETQVQELLAFVDANPSLFEDDIQVITEDEAREDDVRRVLEDITNKIEQENL